MAAHTDGTDVVVVGGGNAGLCAALAAAGRGPEGRPAGEGQRGEHGGNSYYTAGAIRVAHGGLDDVATWSTRTSGCTGPSCRRTPRRPSSATWRG